MCPSCNLPRARRLSLSPGFMYLRLMTSLVLKGKSKCWWQKANTCWTCDVSRYVQGLLHDHEASIWTTCTYDTTNMYMYTYFVVHSKYYLQKWRLTYFILWNLFPLLSGNRERGAGDPRRRLQRRPDRRVRQHVSVPLRRPGYQVRYRWHLQWF